MKNRTGSRYNQAGAVGRAAMVFYEIGSRDFDLGQALVGFIVASGVFEVP